VARGGSAVDEIALWLVPFDLWPRMSLSKDTLVDPALGLVTNARCVTRTHCDVSMTTKSHVRMQLSEATDI
jgi:hypothetical protein